MLTKPSSREQTNDTRRDTRQKGGTAGGQKMWLQGRNVTRLNQYELKQCDIWDPKPGCSAENSCALPRCNRKHRISGKGGFRIIASADESKMKPIWLYFLKAAYHKVIYKCRISYLVVISKYFTYLIIFPIGTTSGGCSLFLIRENNLQQTKRCARSEIWTKDFSRTYCDVFTAV